MKYKIALVVLLAAGGWPRNLLAADPTRAGLAASHAPLFVEHPGELEFSGQLIVRPLQNRSLAQDQNARQRLAGLVLKYYPEVDEYVVRVPAGSGAIEQNSEARGVAENQLAAELLATGFYQYVVPNWICYPLETVPNDPRFAEQWQHGALQTPKAWDFTTGSAEIICAFTDTGIDLTHPDLAPHRVSGFNAYTDLAEADGGDINDYNGHGTHVAGCAAAIGGNGLGVAGVGWNLKIMMVRVTNGASGSASYDNLLQGARWAAEHGAKIVSTSYSGVNYEPVQTTGAYIKSLGGLYCFAAGNDRRNLSDFDWPDVIVCGATDAEDGRTDFSAYGRAVDVFAPGQDILSTCKGGDYCVESGTSMATPIVNGVLGLVWSINPAFTPDEVRGFLFRGCDDLGPPGDDEQYGWGRVNAFKAAQAALAASGPFPPTAAADAAFVPPGGAQRIDVLANDYDSNVGDTLSIFSFDSASVQGGAIALSPGTGANGRDELLYQAPAFFNGLDSFTYVIADNTGLTSSATVQIEDLTGFRAPDNPAHTTAGLRAAYYMLNAPNALPDFAQLTPYKTGAVPQLNYPSTGGAFAGSGQANNVGAVFTGYITVPVTDHYKFYVNSDDGSRLYIGDQIVVDNDGTRTQMIERSGAIALKAGRHAIRIEYFERTLNAGLVVSVRGGGLSKQIIPASLWSRTIAPGDLNCDGALDFFDLDAFALALTDPAAYQTAYPDCDRGNADVNGDGVIDAADLDPFLQLLLGG